MGSIPVSVYTSRVSLGKAARRAGLFVIPEELDPPEELRAAHAARPGAAPLPGFAEAVADPVVNALVCASGVARLQQPEAARRERDRLVEHARRHGPAALPPRQKLMLLNDPIALSRLHLEAGKVVPLRPADKALRADLR
jgi:membrane glycosyltransferase